MHINHRNVCQKPNNQCMHVQKIMSLRKHTFIKKRKLFRQQFRYLTVHLILILWYFCEFHPHIANICILVFEQRLTGGRHRCCLSKPIRDHRSMMIVGERVSRPAALCCIVVPTLQMATLLWPAWEATYPDHELMLNSKNRVRY